jgi:hypothetical protein
MCNNTAVLTSGIAPYCTMRVVCNKEHLHVLMIGRAGMTGVTRKKIYDMFSNVRGLARAAAASGGSFQGASSQTSPPLGR